MKPFKKFTLLDESITTIATDHTIPNMEKKQTLKERMEEIQDNFGKLNGFENYRQYRDVGNNLARYELQDLMQQAYNLDRESPPVTGTAEELIDSIHVNDSNFKYIAETRHINGTLRQEIIRVMQAYTSTQSTTIERLTKALEYAREWIDGQPASQYTIEVIDEALASIKK